MNNYISNFYIKSSDLILTTAVDGNWTVKETIRRFKKKFPGIIVVFYYSNYNFFIGNTANYSLFLKVGGKFSLSGPLIEVLEEDRTLASYKELEDPKASQRSS
jgi:hypothetical protein